MRPSSFNVIHDKAFFWHDTLLNALVNNSHLAKLSSQLAADVFYCATCILKKAVLVVNTHDVISNLILVILKDSFFQTFLCIYTLGEYTWTSNTYSVIKLVCNIYVHVKPLMFLHQHLMFKVTLIQSSSHFLWSRRKTFPITVLRM